jgi:hypothetical protein
MPAINDLLGGWSAVSCSTLIIFGTISADDFHTRMLSEPFGKRFRAAVVEQVYCLVRFSIEQESPIGVSSAKSEIVSSKGAGRWWHRGLLFGSS